MSTDRKSFGVAACLGRARELGEAAWERVLRRIADEDLELESPPIPGLEDAVSNLASQQLARAWTMEATG